MLRRFLRGLLLRSWKDRGRVFGLYHTLGYIAEDKSGLLGVRSGQGFVLVNLSIDENLEKFYSSYEENPTIEWLNGFSETKKVTELPGTQIYIKLK